MRAPAQDASTPRQPVQDDWKRSRSATIGIVVLVLLAIDAFLMPALVRKRRRARRPRAGYAADPVAHEPEVPQQGTAEDPTLRIRTPFTDRIDAISGKAGEYVAYWAVLAVFAYYYEVIARFVFNSPTNWVHESMFLMFGMQYMISGAYAYRERPARARRRRSIPSSRARGKAIADIVTSVFFFIFTITMLWTGWRFAADAVGQPRVLVHRVGHPVLAGEADHADRRGADHPAGRVQADQGHRHPHRARRA